MQLVLTGSNSPPSPHHQVFQSGARTDEDPISSLAQLCMQAVVSAGFIHNLSLPAELIELLLKECHTQKKVDEALLKEYVVSQITTLDFSKKVGGFRSLTDMEQEANEQGFSVFDISYSAPKDHLRKAGMPSLVPFIGLYSKVTSLDLSGHRLINDEDMKNLATLLPLQTVRVANTAVGDTGAEWVASMPSLLFLDMSYCVVQGKDRFFKSLPAGLERLILESATIRYDVGTFVFPSSLIELVLPFELYEEEATSLLASCPHLQHLEFSMAEVYEEESIVRTLPILQRIPRISLRTCETARMLETLLTSLATTHKYLDLRFISGRAEFEMVDDESLGLLRSAVIPPNYPLKKALPASVQVVYKPYSSEEYACIVETDSDEDIYSGFTDDDGDMGMDFQGELSPYCSGEEDWSDDDDGLYLLGPFQ